MTPINTFRTRVLILSVILLAGFGILLFKLWYEQIHLSERYKRSISRQSVRRIRMPGMRGRIFTSDYLLLADNAPRYDLVFYLQEMRRNSRKRTIKNIRAVASKMAAELNRQDNLTKEKILKHIRTQPAMPLIIYKNLSEVELARVYQLMPQMPGIGIEAAVVRNYPQGSLASLVLGYTRMEDVAEAVDRKDYFYYHPAFEGKSGVERAFDTIAGKQSVPGLQSQPGYELMQVDHLGYVSARRLEYAPPLAGSNIILTLDSRAQQLGEKLMRGKRGALVLLNADNGEVLALVSSPQMDVSRTTPFWSMAYYRELLKDPGKPMFNRAIMGSYMPGSIVKPIVALTALQNKWDPTQRIKCDGRSIVANTRISCANRYGHGELDMVEAIERSCNDYFIELGLFLGPERLAEGYSAAGIGGVTGIEIAGSSGTNPRRFINSEKYTWRDNDTALISIGQGKITLSPLQAARFTAAIANGGTLYETRLLKEVYDDKGNLLFRNKPHMTTCWNLPEGALDLVHRGMYQVVNSNTGSGKSAKSAALTIYGKTGTAEVDTPKGRIKNTWFTAFTEHEKQKYALVVMVEEARSGGRDCAPLGKEFFESYFRSRN